MVCLHGYGSSVLLTYYVLGVMHERHDAVSSYHTIYLRFHRHGKEWHVRCAFSAVPLLFWMFVWLFVGGICFQKSQGGTKEISGSNACACPRLQPLNNPVWYGMLLPRAILQFLCVSSILLILRNLRARDNPSLPGSRIH